MDIERKLIPPEARAVQKPSISPKRSSKEEIGKAIRDLSNHKQIWADLRLEERIRLLREAISLAKSAADRMAAADLKNRSVPEDSYDAVISILQPQFVLRLMQAYLNALEDLKKAGRPLYKNSPKVQPNGQVSLEVFPETLQDKILYLGMRADLWFEPGVAARDLPDLQARNYRHCPREGKVALVLGAGNYASLTFSDLLQKLINDIEVVLVKIHPVTEYLGEFVHEIFKPFIRLGFVHIVYGGVEEGEFACTHPLIDEIHMTGSDKTFEAIVFGTGPEGEKNKLSNTSRLKKRVTGELGNVTPVIVVPGPWKPKELAYAAESITSLMTLNHGYTCIANRILVQQEDWPMRKELLKGMEELFACIKGEKAYYPNTTGKIKDAISTHKDARLFGSFEGDSTPWVFASDLKLEDSPPCFTKEIFGSFYGETALKSESAAEFLDKAVEFCNEHLWGTLGAMIVIHPKSLKDPSVKEAFDRALVNLRYGTIGINTTPSYGTILGTAAWGAYPGSTYSNIQSGIGWVNNTLMFEKVQKTVIYGLFYQPLKHPIFPTAKNKLKVAKSFLNYQKNPSWINVFRTLISIF